MILLASPDDLDRSLLRHVLAREGFAVRETDSAETAMRLAQRKDVALVILAIEYWRQGKIDLSAMRRGTGQGGSSLVILLGQPQSRDEIHEAVRGGVAGLVVREGFNVERFVDKVRCALSRGSEGSAETGSDGGLVARTSAPVQPPPASESNETPPPPQRPVSPNGKARKAATSRTEERHRRIMDSISTLNVLPTTATLPWRVLQLYRSRSATLPQFAEALSADPALASKIIALANSAWFSPSRPIAKLSQAAAMIGLDNLFPLVLGLSFAGIHSKLNLPVKQSIRLRDSSLLKAVAAREYAERHVPSQAEEAYTCGLFQDIALPLMFAADPSVWEETSAALDLDDVSRKMREEAIYGASHGALGQLVLRRLGLPTLYQEATAAHHDENWADVTANAQFDRSVKFAAMLPHDLTDWKRACLCRLNIFLGPDNGPTRHDIDVANLLNCASQKHDEMLSMLGMSRESTSHAKQFVREAADALARGLGTMIGQSNATVSSFETRQTELEKENKMLERRARLSDYDGLTKVLNRRAFLSRAESALSEARDHGFQYGIGFVDLDDFKAINDQYGHAFGDRVLKAVSEVLCNSVRDGSNVGRLGGDEFAFLVLAKSEHEANLAIKRITETLGAVTVAQGAAITHVSLSVGLTWLGVPASGQLAHFALEQADQLMYQAKRTGKGACVVNRSEGILVGEAPSEDRGSAGSHA